MCKVKSSLKKESKRKVVTISHRVGREGLTEAAKFEQRFEEVRESVRDVCGRVVHAERSKYRAGNTLGVVEAE